jgi:hypothetical protein
MPKIIIKRNELLKELDITLSQFSQFITDTYARPKKQLEQKKFSQYEATLLKNKYRFYIESKLYQAQERRRRNRATIADIILLNNPNRSQKECLLTGSEKRQTMIQQNQHDKNKSRKYSREVKITTIMLSQREKKRRSKLMPDDEPARICS